MRALGHSCGLAIRFSRIRIVLAACALVCASSLAGQASLWAQSRLPAGSVGKVTGEDISVEGGVFPSSVKGATSLFISSGSLLTVHSGTAKLELVGGTTVDACGPAKFTVLEAGGAYTLALNFGRLRVHAGNGAAVRIFTPFIVATPVSISEIGSDFTLGLDAKDSICVYTGEGAGTLEQQFGGQNLVVPAASEFLLEGEKLNPAVAPEGSCRCVYVAPAPSTIRNGVTTATATPPASNNAGSGSGAAGSAGSNTTAANAAPAGGNAGAPTQGAAQDAGATASATPIAAPTQAPAAQTSSLAASEAPTQPPPQNANASEPANTPSAPAQTPETAASKTAEAPAQGNAQVAENVAAPAPAPSTPAAPQGVAIDLSRASEPPAAPTATSPASSAAATTPPKSEPASPPATPPVEASAAAPTTTGNAPAFAGKLNQTPPTGVDVATTEPNAPQITNPQWKAAPSPLSYEAPPPPPEERQMPDLQAKPNQGFALNGHVPGKPKPAAKPSSAPASVKAAVATPAPKPAKPYQMPGTGFWAKFKRLFSKPASQPEPKPEG